jgi:hypothetical protein
MRLTPNVGVHAGSTQVRYKQAVMTSSLTGSRPNELLCAASSFDTSTSNPTKQQRKKREDCGPNVRSFTSGSNRA